MRQDKTCRITAAPQTHRVVMDCVRWPRLGHPALAEPGDESLIARIAAGIPPGSGSSASRVGTGQRRSSLTASSAQNIAKNPPVKRRRDSSTCAATQLRSILVGANRPVALTLVRPELHRAYPPTPVRI